MSTAGTEYTPLIVPMTVSVSDQTVDMSSVSVSNQQVDMSTSLTIEAIKNYERLINKPKINGVELFGDKSAYDLNLAYKIKYDTTEGWANNIDYIPLEGELIIYTDYETRDGVNIPAIKVGDGMAYAADLPFVNDNARDEFLDHIKNDVIHITQDERAFWNNKVRCYYSNESVVFTTK